MIFLYKKRKGVIVKNSLKFFVDMAEHLCYLNFSRCATVKFYKKEAEK